MFEGLFVLTVIFVAYIAYQVMSEKKADAQTAVAEATPAPAPAPKPAPAAKQAESLAPTASASTAPEAARASAPSAATRAGIRNPATGEVSAAFTNYRFAKRWIKEALVSEGLLDKIYKNNELDADAEAKIKDAVAKLEAMAKYQA